MDIFIQTFVAIGVMAIWFMVKKTKTNNQKVNQKLFWLAIGLGVAGLVVSAAIEYFTTNDGNTKYHLLPLGEIIKDTLIIGFVEEFFKFAPLAFIIYKHKDFQMHADGLIYFAVAGMSFGILENITYHLTGDVFTSVLRIFLMPFFHAVLTATVGLMLVRMKRGRGNLLTVVAAFLAVVAIHSLYNFGLMYGKVYTVLASIALSLTISGGLFGLVYLAKWLDKSLPAYQPPVSPVAGLSGPIIPPPPAAVPPAPMMPVASAPVLVQAAPVQPAARVQSNNNLGVAAFVLGICGIILPLLSLPLGILSIVFGAIGLKKSPKTLAAVGLALGVVDLFVTLLTAVLLAYFLVNNP